MLKELKWMLAGSAKIFHCFEVCLKVWWVFLLSKDRHRKAKRILTRKEILYRSLQCAFPRIPVIPFDQKSQSHKESWYNEFHKNFSTLSKVRTAPNLFEVWEKKEWIRFIFPWENRWYSIPFGQLPVGVRATQLKYRSSKQKNGAICLENGSTIQNEPHVWMQAGKTYVSSTNKRYMGNCTKIEDAVHLIMSSFERVGSWSEQSPGQVNQIGFILRKSTLLHFQ